MSLSINDPVLFRNGGHKIQGFISNIADQYEVTFYNSSKQTPVRKKINENDIVSKLKDNELNLQLSYILKCEINNKLKVKGKKVHYISSKDSEIKDGIVKANNNGSISILSNSGDEVIHQDLAWF